MSTRRITRRARLRAHALHEPYLAAQQAVKGKSANDPIVVPAGLWQQRLEGHLFRQLGYFHAGKVHDETMMIQRIRPEANALEIDFSGIPDYQIESLAGALPTWHPGADTLTNGYPGLRYRAITDGTGVEFSILGRPCSITIRGVTSAAFADACALTPNSQLIGARTEPFLSPVESLVEETSERATDIAVSAIIRRAGVLLLGNHDSIDLWPTTPQRLSVEILTHDRSEQTFERMLASLTSPDFAPRLLLKKTEGHRGYRSLFQIIGHDVEIDLRIQTL